jgi:hypothetical protein
VEIELDRLGDEDGETATESDDARECECAWEGEEMEMEAEVGRVTEEEEPAMEVAGEGRDTEPELVRFTCTAPDELLRQCPLVEAMNPAEGLWP